MLLRCLPLAFLATCLFVFDTDLFDERTGMDERMNERTLGPFVFLVFFGDQLASLRPHSPFHTGPCT